MVLDGNSDEENSWFCTERAWDILGRRTCGDFVGTKELSVIGNKADVARTERKRRGIGDEGRVEKEKPLGWQ